MLETISVSEKFPIYADILGCNEMLKKISLQRVVEKEVLTSHVAQSCVSCTAPVDSK